jgi:hypothetical protein
MSLLNVSPIHKRINHGYFVGSSTPSHQKRHQREQGERQEIDGARYRISTRKEFGHGLPNEQGVQPKLSRDEQAQSKQSPFLCGMKQRPAQRNAESPNCTLRHSPRSSLGFPATPRF